MDVCQEIPFAGHDRTVAYMSSMVALPTCTTHTQYQAREKLSMYLEVVHEFASLVEELLASDSYWERTQLCKGFDS